MNVFGGGERVAANLCNDLVNYFQVSLIMYNNASSVYRLKDEVKKIHLLNKDSCTRVQIHFSALKLRKYIKENNIDVIMIIGRSSYPLVPILASLGIKTRIIFCDQSTLEYTKYVPRGVIGGAYRLVTQWAINTFCARIVTLTIKEKNNYQRKYSIPENKLLSVYNYIEYKKLPEYNDCSKKIITVARIDYAKGMELLIEVAAMVLSEHPDWRWDVYGDGDSIYTNKIIKLKNQYGLDGKLFFCGKSDKIYDKYPQYSMFVFTSRYEGFGLTLLEAMAFGLPVVSFDIFSGPSEIVRHNVNGYLVKNFDVFQMKNYICDLIKNPEKRKAFRDNSRIDKEKFDKKNIVKKWKKILLGL